MPRAAEHKLVLPMRIACAVHSSLCRAVVVWTFPSDCPERVEVSLPLHVRSAVFLKRLIET